MLKQLLKAAVSVALAPGAVLVDLLTLPASAESGGHPFGRTARLLTTAGDAVTQAVNPEGAQDV